MLILSVPRRHRKCTFRKITLYLWPPHGTLMCRSKTQKSIIQIDYKIFDDNYSFHNRINVVHDHWAHA